MNVKVLAGRNLTKLNPLGRNLEPISKLLDQRNAQSLMINVLPLRSNRISYSLAKIVNQCGPQLGMIGTKLLRPQKREHGMNEHAPFRVMLLWL
jgi:hypothetical protein